MPEKDEFPPPEPVRPSNRSSESVSAESSDVGQIDSTTEAGSVPLLGKQRRETTPRSKSVRSKISVVKQPEVVIKNFEKEESVDMPLPLDTETKQPLVIDLGSISRADARRLKRGESGAIHEAQRAAAIAKSAGAPDVPIVLLYRRKTRRRRIRFPFPFPGF
jgi:hypothetical protein